jgi:hypothetical protein
MYSFTRQNIGNFVIYQSVQKAGDTHLKKFSTGVTPHNQETINVYAVGDFRFSVGEFTQDLPAGSTTLDLEIDEFPAGEVATEEVLSPVAIRYCISGDWLNKSIIDVNSQKPYTVLVSSIVFILTGSFNIAGNTVNAGAYTTLYPNCVVNGNGKLLVIS